MNTALKTKWENPKASVGKQVAATRSKTIWEASGPALELFEQEIFRTIEEVLEANKEHLDSEEELSHTVSFHLWMIGRKPDSAHPTIVFTSKSPGLRAKVIKVIKKDGLLTIYPGVRLKSMDRMPATALGNALKGDCRSPATSKSSSSLAEAQDCSLRVESLPGSRTLSTKSTQNFPYGASVALVQAHESQQICGTSLLIGGEYEATLGGVVVIDGLFYGFTAMHPHRRRLDDFAISDRPSESVVIFDRDSDTTSYVTSLQQSVPSSSLNLPSTQSDARKSALPTDSLKDHFFQQEGDNATEAPELHDLGFLVAEEGPSALEYRLLQLDDPRYHTVNRIASPGGSLGSCQQVIARAIAAYPEERHVLIASGKSGVLRGSGGHVTLPESFEGHTTEEITALMNYPAAVAAYGQGHNAQSFADLAAYLKSPRGPAPGRDENTFVSRYDLSPQNDRPFLTYRSPVAFTRDADLFRYGQITGAILFLNGNPSPEWLAAVGSRYSLDPAFFAGHLHPIPPRSNERHFDTPNLASTRHIKLRYTTIGLIRLLPDLHSIKDLTSWRKDLTRKLLRPQDHQGDEEAGRSILRQVWLHDAQYYSSDQLVSIYLQFTECTWKAFIWLDSGRDPQDGFWQHTTQLSRPLIKPTTWLSPNLHGSPDGFDGTQQSSDAHFAQAHYGDRLNKAIAVSEPFYALTGIFESVAVSENQFINMMDSVLDAIPYMDGPGSTLPNVVYNRKVLQQHTQNIRDCISWIRSRGGTEWPRAPENLGNDATIAAQSLLTDFENILDRAQRLISLCEEREAVEMNIAVFQESKRSMDQAQDIRRLTLLTMFFLPLSFTASLFGMNATAFGSGITPMWVWPSVTAPVLILSVIALYGVPGIVEQIHKILGFFRANALTNGNKSEALSTQQQASRSGLCSLKGQAYGNYGTTRDSSVHDMFTQEQSPRLAQHGKSAHTNVAEVLTGRLEKPTFRRGLPSIAESPPRSAVPSKDSTFRGGRATSDVEKAYRDPFRNE
ncbi:MAG: hypothetical protein Q9169_007458, partial [Polycauliona sp. 2 TL-2023]